MAERVLIVGAGQGGFQAAASLRDKGFCGSITLIGDEPEPPYQRPPLSKTYLTGDRGRDTLHLRPASFYTANRIDLLLGERVRGIDRGARRVELEGDRALAYDRLIIATGARNRRLMVPGADLEGVLSVRDVADAEALRQRLPQAEVVIVGAGFVGLELAAVLAKRGVRTHVIESAQRIMSRAVTEPLAAFLAKAHEAWGTRIHLGTEIARIDGDRGRVTGVTTTAGRHIPAGLVLVGIGIVPNTELAAEAGLSVENGIVTDANLCTSDTAISAVGDCAACPSRFAAGRVRLESVQNAVDQGRCLAANLTGRPQPYSSVPWFWSDQADLKLQIVGLTAGCDRTVLRGDPESRAFSVFCFRGGRLVGIESLNRAADHMIGRRLLAADAPLSPMQAADPDFDLKAHADGAARAMSPLR